jgi:hypothetical protein
LTLRQRDVIGAEAPISDGDSQAAALATKTRTALRRIISRSHRNVAIALSRPIVLVAGYATELAEGRNRNASPHLPRSAVGVADFAEALGASLLGSREASLF